MAAEEATLRDDGRRARIMAAVTGHDPAAGAGELDRIVIHQATGMIAAQLDDTVANALARLRASAFTSGRPMYDVAQDVVERRVRFDE